MKTQMKEIDEASLHEAAEYIRGGGLVAFPTETVYGLGANAQSDSAVKKIFEVKGRPQDNPLIVHIADFSKAGKYVKKIPEAAYRLAERFMPGAVTLVMEKSNTISDFVSCGLATVGIRVPSHIGAHRFLETVDLPIAAPSANTSKRPSPTQAKHVYDDLHGKIPLILDGGSCEIGIESTVIDVSGETPIILRPGYVTIDEIKSVVGKAVPAEENSPVRSPGMKYKHYAPKCQMTLVTGNLKDVCLRNYDEKCIVFAYEDTARKIRKEFEGKYKIVSLGENNKIASNRFYGMLRAYENDCDRILCECPKDDALRDSLLNRMMKAAGGNIV